MKKVILYLVFAISAVAGQAQEPAIVMTTAKSINSQFTFGIEAAASNTPIQIDWGNGVKENYTVGNSLINFFSYPLKGNSVKIWGEGITKLYVASMELTALDVTRATSLTFLFITINQISTLDLSNCNALTFVDCSRNLLNRLNLPNTSTLNVNCANNRLTFATLPVKQPTWTAYSYSPQQNYTLPKQTYSTNEEIDLSSQLNVGSQTTTYTWKTESGTTLVNGTDYNENGGKFTFLNTFTDSLYCEMANPAFPDLILTTTKISIHQLPNVVMTTTSAVGSTFTFSIGATSSNATIKVDWGNGTLASYTIGENTTVSGTLAGSTIKIYGVDISYLGLSEKKLTSLDVTNNTALKSLDCSSNQITTLDVSKNSALTQLTCYKNQLTALDVSKNTALINLFCGFNQLSALDVSKNTALTQLLCNSNQLTAIDVSKNTALISLYCNSNLLTALNVFNNTSLTLLCCQSNQLTSLNVPNNSSLTTLWIDNNSLTFPTLPVKQTSWTSYIYSPQAKIVLPKTEYALNEEVDLSSQLTAGGNTTVYTWKTAGGKTLVKDEDYTENSGKFKFLKQPGDFLYCEMRNATFPDLTLSTEKISITQTDPSITMTTTSAIGSTFTFSIGATTSNTPIKVDWGNGTLASYTIGEYSTVSGTLAGSTIKIYGVGIRNLDLSDKKLTSLDVTNNTALTNLDCSWNQITTLDVTKNTSLTMLYCYSNHLNALVVSNNSSLTELLTSNNRLTFSTLPVKQASWDIYHYSPQAKFTLPKNEYALNEVIDLSSQLTAGGNTTTYVWKTTDGITLVKDVDYTESNGKFTFKSPPVGYIYCEMRNATFPELTLVTENIFITQTDPSITMTTTSAIGSTFTFKIGATTSNIPIKVDWGNGTLASYTIGEYSTVSGTLAGSTIKIYGVGIAYLNLSSKNLTSLDVSNTVTLKSLNCQYNSLTTLDVAKNTALTTLDCSLNKLTNLDVTNNTALTELYINNNILTFSTLPVKQASWTTYSYSPQAKIVLPKTEYALNEEVDLSSQLTAGGNTTVYTWKTAGGKTLVKDEDYTENSGKFKFLKQPGDFLYCEMRNATFPDLTLSTEKISITQTDPSITMTTTSAVGSTFTFKIGATTSNTPIKVDWGNGTLVNYTIGEYSTVSGTLAGSTIKIYGVGIRNLDLSDKKLTSLDVTNNTALTNLSCGLNKLTALDLSKNTALISLYCDSNLLTALNVFNSTSLTLLCCQSNQLTSLNVPNNSSLTTLWIDNNSLTFPTLPVKQTSWTSYIYSPQAKIVLPKTEYALNEEVDLSSQLTAGGNTTVYTWKTAGGKTLVKDEDYTENSGKFKFLKQPGDFLYCEMRNATFPDLTLSTEKISITQTDPSITMTTTSAIGSTFTFKIGATTSNTPIKVDWGNGTLVNYTIGEYSTVSGTLAGSTIKIYGLGIRNLDLSDKKLTSLDVTNNTALTNLNCSWNQITTLDVAKNIELETLYCDINKITTLDVSKNISLKELKFSFNQVTALDVTNNAALTYLDCSWNQITTLDVTKNTELSILNCSSNSLTTIDVTKNTELEILYCDHNKITTLDVSKNTELTQLMCSSNPLIALDITNNTKLIKLWCSSNLLTAIDVSKNTALTTLDCSLNQLTNLDVTNNTALTELYINNNILTFSTLPVKQTAWTKYIYSPQAKLVLPKKVYAHSEEIDLSSEFSVDGNITSFVWKTQNGRVLTKNIDYTEDNGIFRFLNPYMVDSIYCEMTNASFPLLTLVTQNITFPLTNPVITLTSSNPIGSNFELTIACEYKSAIKIDWGKGTISNHNVINSTFWRGLEDSNMKIYGVGIKKLNVSNNNITELNTSNCESLKELDCNSNKLKSIDISANTNLYKLNCSNNLLMFSNLPIVSFTAYTYSPQAIVNLAKKRYGLTETVDLSSESIINGNATNYVWKTKGGSTLTAGTDYNVTNGVTTFLKVQPDSVYCEMTNATFPALTLKTSSIKVSQFPLSVNDSKLSASVFPNPASELVTIELNENIFRVEIFNSLGIKLLEQKTDIAPRVVLPLNNIPAGILIVRAYTKNGYTENKIVKL